MTVKQKIFLKYFIKFLTHILYTITLCNFAVPTCCLVGDPLSGNGRGSPNHIVSLFLFYLLFYLLNLFLI